MVRTATRNHRMPFRSHSSYFRTFCIFCGEDPEVNRLLAEAADICEYFSGMLRPLPFHFEYELLQSMLIRPHPRYACSSLEPGAIVYTGPTF